MRIFITLGLIATTCTAYAQVTNLAGRVQDSETQKSIAFAHVVLQNAKQGTITDVDGNFGLNTPLSADTILVSFLGYETQKVVFNHQKYLIISLKPKVEKLKEVVVLPGHNPAHPIIEKAIANKKKNDPEQLASFSYQSYQKFYMTLQNPAKPLEEDTSRMAKFISKSHVFLSESVTNRKFMAPNRSREEVLANRVSGYSNPVFSMLVTDLQPFGFYKDLIFLLDKDYLNPISKGSTSRYDFTLEDSIADQNHWIYLISFQPNPNAKFNGLKGILYIHSDGYAIRNVIAEIDDQEAKINLKIQQQYQKIEGQWFPTQLYADIFFKEYKLNDWRLLGVGRSYLSNVKILPELERKSFDQHTVVLLPTAAKRDDTFWNQYRTDSLSAKEKSTYQFLDSVGEKSNLDRLMTGLQIVSTRRWTLGSSPIDLNIEDLVRFNQYEGTRVGIGLESNYKLSERFRLGGYSAYGFRDQGFKYGGHVLLNLAPSLDFFIKGEFKQDLIEVGRDLNIRKMPTMPYQLYRDWISSMADSILGFKISTGMRPARNGWQVNFSYQDLKRNPTYQYQFQPSADQDIHDYRQQEISIGLHYHHKEKYMSLAGYQVFTGFELPTFSVNLAQGKAAGQLYSRLRFQIDNQFKTKIWGTSFLGISGGYIWGNLPFGLLFTGLGGNHPDNLFYFPNYFQTMHIYEFLSDRYLMLSWSHNVGKLWNTRRSRPELILAHNAGIGDLSKISAHQIINFKTMEKGYLEGGLMINNLVRFNYVDIAWLGIGGGAFMRYGTNAFPDVKDNLVYRISATFGF